MATEMKCNACGSSVTADTVTEALAWSDAHDEFCPATSEPTP